MKTKSGYFYRLKFLFRYKWTREQLRKSFWELADTFEILTDELRDCVKMSRDREDSVLLCLIRLFGCLLFVNVIGSIFFFLLIPIFFFNQFILGPFRAAFSYSDSQIAEFEEKLKENS